MRVVPEGERLAPPSLCFICETSPQREVGVNVVDTQRQFNPPTLSHLAGTKFICERCVEEAARLLGFTRSDDVELANTRLEAANRLIAETQVHVASLANGIKEVLNSVELNPIEKTRKSPDVVEKKEKAKNGS